MAFPDDPLCPAVELFYDGVWNDINADVDAADDVVIRHGREDWSDGADPSRCTVMLDNVDGKYSPRNPMSPLYKKIGRNTPLRVRIGDKDASLYLPGVQEAYVSTPDAAALDITGDFDLRADVEPRVWRPERARGLGRRFAFATDQMAWAWFLQADGTMRVWWSPDGTFASALNANSTAAVPEVGRQSVRCTLDVSNGSGVWEVRFYTASSFTGSWTQLGATVTGAAATSVFGADVPLEIGRVHPDGFNDVDPFEGRMYGFEVRSGIGGTLIAAPDFTAQDAGMGEFTDTTGKAWSISSPAHIKDLSVRFAGEVSAWPARWQSELDVRTPITASGIRRRLSQGASPLSSALYRGITGGNITPPVAYWPCEDDKDATSFASALGHEPMRFLGDTKAIKPAAFTDIPSSLPIPTVSTGGRFEGNVPAYSDSDYARSMVLANIPDGGVSAEQVLLRIRTIGGTTEAWFLNVQADGNLRLICFAHGGATLVDKEIAFTVNGTSGLFRVELTQNGADIDWKMGHAALDSASSVSYGEKLVNQSFGRVHQMIVGQNYDLNGVSVGHVMLLRTSEEYWDIVRFAKAWDGDTASDRFSRLAAEESVPATLSWGDTGQVGPQRPLTFLELAGEVAEADLGVLIDRRDALGLHLRSRVSLYNQTPALTLDYMAGEVSAPFEPVEDDQDVRNDITVKRVEGSSARAVQETGPLNAQAPTADLQAVGRYDSAATINAYSDGQLPDQAGWRLRLGTVDEARYPSVTVDLFANPHLIDAVKAVEVGDRLTITNPPPWLPPEMIDLIVQGYPEVLNALVWKVTFNCTPGSPWNVWALEASDYSHLDSAYSETAGVFTAGTDTALVVAGGRFEGFEPGDRAVPHVDGGALGWVRDDTEAHTGGWSLRSGAVIGMETSDAVVKVLDATHVSFWYKVSSESGFDFFRFLIDGVEQFTASGEVGWTKSATYAVAAGQVLTFRYTKDGSVSGGRDAAWIDDLLLARPEWETDSALNQVPFDIHVSGVQLRVTAITGESSPQTFTVEQAPINGIVKTIPAGSEVRLTHPAVLAL